MTCFDVSRTRSASEKRNSRAGRVRKLEADLERSRAALSTEQDHTRLMKLMKQHVLLQDALLAELIREDSCIS